MKPVLNDVLQDLFTTPGPSGFERDIAQKAKAYLSPVSDSLTVDNVGNVIARIDGTDPALKPVMVYAHMDRVGMIVSFVTEDGFLRLQAIGGVPDKVLPGSRVLVRTVSGAWQYGVVGTKCNHLMTEEEKQRVQPMRELLVDVGADSAEQAKEMGFAIGCPVVYEPVYRRLGGRRVAATALDNCGCVAALVGIARQLYQARPQRTTYLAATVWEEYNQRAAAMAVRRINPIAAISMDMLLAGDTPDVKGVFEASVGQGPVASHYNYSDGADNGTIAHPGLYALAERTAAAHGTGLQHYVCYASLGDNAYSQLTGDGPACIEIVAPVRYADSTTEVADLDDIENLSLLVSEMVQGMDASFVQARYTLD